LQNEGACCILLLVLGGKATPTADEVKAVLNSVGIEELRGGAACSLPSRARWSSPCVGVTRRRSRRCRAVPQSIDELVEAGRKKLVNVGGGGGAAPAASLPSAGATSGGCPAASRRSRRRRRRRVSQIVHEVRRGVELLT